MKPAATATAASVNGTPTFVAACASAGRNSPTVVALGAIANRELNCEVDAEPDKQNGESDRYHVQRADHRTARARR